MILVTGCERSGTTIIAQQLSQYYDLPYVHEIYPQPGQDCVLKHSLNCSQNIKHLEYLDFLFPEAQWYYVIRDGREVCRSIVQKIWQGLPHTRSLDDAILQWQQVWESTLVFAMEHGAILKYECPLDCFTYTPKTVYPEYFTQPQIEYIEQRLGPPLKAHGYL